MLVASLMCFGAVAYGLFDMPLDTVDGQLLVKRAASLVPAQYDPMAKTACFSDDSYEGFASLVARFAEEALPNVSSLAEFITVLGAPNAKARKSLKAAKPKLDRLLDELSFETDDVALEPATAIPLELSVELFAIEPFDAFFAVARAEPVIATQTRFWHNFVTASSVRDFIRTFTRVFVTVALKQTVAGTCSHPDVGARLAIHPSDDPLKSACVSPTEFAIDLVRTDSSYLKLNKHGINERVGNLFWSRLARVHEDFNTIEKALAAFPAEFYPELHARCTATLDAALCNSLLVSFSTALGHAPLDPLSVPAILESFGDARITINPDAVRALVQLLDPAQAAELLAEATSLGHPGGADLLAQLLSPIAGKHDKVGGFWVAYFSASSADALVAVLRQGYRTVKLARLTSAISRASRHRRLNRSYLALAIRAAAINSEAELLALIPADEVEAINAGLARSQNQLTRIIKGVLSRNHHYRYVRRVTEIRECAICLTVDSTPTQAVTPCGHAFCATCLGKWLFGHKSCPSCRQPLPKPGDSRAALPLAP